MAHKSYIKSRLTHEGVSLLCHEKDNCEKSDDFKKSFITAKKEIVL